MTTLMQTQPAMGSPSLAGLPVVRGPSVLRGEEVLTPEALRFVGELDRTFGPRIVTLLNARAERRTRLRNGEGLDFLEHTREIREASWQVASAAPGLIRRQVEITGPPTPQMTVNALNSGADVWMADLEDATAPTWANLISGQVTVLAALDRTLDFTTPAGKHYALGDRLASIVVRPRGLHLVDEHVIRGGRPVAASLLDFGLHFFHGANRQLANGGVPGFYLPKLESHLEARLWNDIFNFSESYLSLPQGVSRATVLIETLPAAFEMEEILFELRDHAAGLNAGRWDYVFSAIKCLGAQPSAVLPDRAAVTMTAPFMRSYTNLLVATCHRRGAHAIGGMAAAVPSASNPEQFEVALESVAADKQREAADGFDGSWVAHPALVPVCRAAFVEKLGSGDHQKSELRSDVQVRAADLLALDQTPGEITEAGVRGNVNIALRYLAAWIEGAGAVALDGLMEDAATVEIARTQLWQWRTQHSRLADGGGVSEDLLHWILAQERRALVRDSDDLGETPARGQAAELLEELIFSDRLPEFFTTIAYGRYLVEPCAS